MKTKDEVIELDPRELERLLDQIEATMGESVARPLRQLLRWYLYLLDLVREKKFSIDRLRRLLFGSRTERTRDVVPPAASPSESPAPDGKPPRRQRRPGHGRKPAKAYTGCAQVMVTNDLYGPGDSCPSCQKGTLYRQNRWSPVVRLKGQPPVGGTVYHLERLRCGLCGEIRTAEQPEEAGADRYDVTVASVVAVLRYGQGMPWNRIEQMQNSAGVPLASSVQWEIVRDALDRGVEAAYNHLVYLAAQGSLVHNDDTTMHVVELDKKAKLQQPLREDAPERTGVFTTSVLSLDDARPTIALFFTGPRHSGENLRELFAQRQEELPPPIQMCDALSRNMPPDLRVIVSNCLSHARRNFVDLVNVFPSEVQYVLECLKKVYTVDADAKERGLSADERLALHQESSRPVMDELRKWLDKQFDERLVEPNSSLGEAISYMRKHWDKLTLFLRVPGAPLDNNICEQALKTAIRHRNNSRFYKTTRGSRVGDIYMSIIHTCYFAGADPFDYLTELQRNHERVRAAPAEWMPWNYRQQLTPPTTPSNGRGPPAAQAALPLDSSPN